MKIARCILDEHETPSPSLHRALLDRHTQSPQAQGCCPERTWERPDYLPYLDDAKAFNVNLFTTDELVQAQINREILVVDCEVYMNYFLVAFASLTTGKVFYLETTTVLDSESRAQLSWVLAHFKTVSFNGLGFDLPFLRSLLLVSQRISSSSLRTNSFNNRSSPGWCCAVKRFNRCRLTTST